MRTIQNLRKIIYLGAAICMLEAGGIGLALADDRAAAEKAPVISLDKLLVIPDSVNIEVDRRGGATRPEWRARFVEAENSVVEAKQNLDESLARLTDMAAQGGNWKVAAPGGQASIDDTTPMSYGLKQQIRREREEVVNAERALVDLRVQANLAGVPDEWWMDR